jgi:UDP:flavonoid glycosyltransferase YjiC (YdhE family)
MDQHLNMGYVRRAGAGELLRVGTVTPEDLRGSVRRLLEDRSVADGAVRLREEFGRYPAAPRFAAILGRAASSHQAAEKASPAGKASPAAPDGLE